jgi:hypothetical protein
MVAEVGMNKKPRRRMDMEHLILVDLRTAQRYLEKEQDLVAEEEEEKEKEDPAEEAEKARMEAQPNRHPMVLRTHPHQNLLVLIQKGALRSRDDRETGM